MESSSGFHMGGAEIVLILGLLLILGVCALALFGLIYLIVRVVVNRPAQATPAVSLEVAVQNQQKWDREHLKLLSIFHLIGAGLALLGLGFICLHYLFMHSMFSNPDMWKNHGNATPPPKAFLDMFVWMYLIFGFICVVVSVLNLLSGIFLTQKRHRIFSMVVAGLNCLQIPFGMALGVFTIIVLSRESVRGLYEKP